MNCSCTLESFHHLIESRTSLFRGMVREPIADVEIFSRVESVCRDRITVKVIRDYGLNRMKIRWFVYTSSNSATNFEAVSSKVVSEELNR